jgi:predicted P-loop ATPase
VQYLDGLTWDGTERIDLWLPTYLHVEDTPYTGAIGAKWLISAVARARNPGCKADCTLVLTGDQGFRKSSALEILGGEFYVDGSTIGDLADKDSRMIVATGWIVELPEMTAVLRTRQRESVKAFLSCREDNYRLPFGRTVSSVPRRCVISMTPNDQQFLTDETGNRRYWIATVPSRIDLDALARDRDQIWAEACERYRQYLAAPSDSDRWWLTDAEQLLADQVALSYAEPNPWADVLRAHLDKYPEFAQETNPTTLAALGKVLGVAKVDQPKVSRDIAKAARIARLTDFHTDKGNVWRRR